MVEGAGEGRYARWASASATIQRATRTNGRTALGGIANVAPTYRSTRAAVARTETMIRREFLAMKAPNRRQGVGCADEEAAGGAETVAVAGISGPW